MRILFLALDIDMKVDRGDTIHAKQLARYLRQRGNSVEMVVAGAPAPVDTVDSDVRIGSGRSVDDLATILRCLRIVRRTGTEVIYERRLSPKIAFALSRLTGIPFVVEINGVEEEAEMQGRRRRSPMSPLKDRVRSAMLRRARYAVAVTDRLGDIVRTRHHLALDQIAVIPNGVDPERFHPTDAPAARNALGWPEGDWIVFVGNLVVWQGVEVLVRAAPRILQAHPAARIAVVGDGTSRPALEALAAESGCANRIVFCGSVAHERVPLLLGASSVCVAPFTRARNEVIGVSPLKLYEYLACGRPVVASDVPGVGALLEASGGGLAVPPGDSDALADAVNELLRDPVRAQAMGRRARDYAVAECSWARTAERVERVLRDAVSSGPDASRRAA